MRSRVRSENALNNRSTGRRDVWSMSRVYQRQPNDAAHNEPGCTRLRSGLDCECDIRTCEYRSSERLLVEGPATHESATANSDGSGWRKLRLILGLLQMFGAVVSLTLLATMGVTAISLSAVAVTSLMTTVSVVLFGGRPVRQVAHPRRTRRV
jgi:hypothetical protein